MKSSDRAILLGLAIAGLLAAFWFVILSPKREEASVLGDEVTSLETSVEEARARAAAAAVAKDDYEKNYHRMVVLGKAVPGDDDSASLIDQTQALASRAEIDFRSIVLAEGSATPTPPPAAATTADPPAEGAIAAPASAPAAPTEAAAATVPIGATVGPAGLPVMPYDLNFQGDFFEIADFMAELDSMVRTGVKGVGVDGRLLTVDGFVLSPDLARGFPHLDVNLRVTSFVAPADQGSTAGATPAAPGAAPLATTPPASTPIPTAAAATP